MSPSQNDVSEKASVFKPGDIETSETSFSPDFLADDLEKNPSASPARENDPRNDAEKVREEARRIQEELEIDRLAKTDADDKEMY